MPPDTPSSTCTPASASRDGAKRSGTWTSRRVTGRHPGADRAAPTRANVRRGRTGKSCRKPPTGQGTASLLKIGARAAAIGSRRALDSRDGRNSPPRIPRAGRHRRAHAHPRRSGVARVSIRDWPDGERPREKLLAHGAGVLSDAELLAVFLGSGRRGLTAVDLARRLLADAGGLKPLLDAPRAQAGLGAV